MSNIHEGVIKIINEISDAIIEECDYDKKIKDLGVDSLDMANILLELEEKFHITIKDEDIEDLKSINLIVEYINKTINK